MNFDKGLSMDSELRFFSLKPMQFNLLYFLVLKQAQ